MYGELQEAKLTGTGSFNSFGHDGGELQERITSWYEKMKMTTKDRNRENWRGGREGREGREVEKEDEKDEKWRRRTRVL
jgi:hypothetical protein